MKRTIIGLDLQREFSQISYYNERSGEIVTASIQKNTEKYLIPTPEGLFGITKEAMDLGIMILANFIKTCISYVNPAIMPERIYIMITMREICMPWIEDLRSACEMIGISRSHVFLQSYRESFFWYVLNQRKDIWVHSASMYEYDENDQIRSYVMKIDKTTVPALVTVDPGGVLDLSGRNDMEEEEWNELRDRSFLEMVRENFKGENISSTFLLGNRFDKEWAVESLRFLCKKRHVFQGSNLFTKGACYGLCQKLQVGKKLNDFLFSSEDLVETNLSMRLELRGKQSNYILVNAGVNWFDACHTCEIILDQDRELVFYAKSMMGGEAASYTVPLVELPERPRRATRLQVRAEFQSAVTCKITVRDMGFGDFYPASGLTWESILKLQ